jgi:protein-S-isoprenylcysteine O-methyltransferase Ste14
MNDHQLFRLILLAAFALFLPFGVYHRWKSRTGEPLHRRQEGIFMLVVLRATGLAGILGVLVWLFNPAWMAWAELSVPGALRWTGVGLGLVSGLLFCWTLRSLGRNLTDTVVTRREHTLITTGPYRWVRHPFYTATALAVPASTLAAANWFFFATGGLAFLLLAVRTRKEEANLIARFGDDYRDYMQRTGRFLPRLRFASRLR